MAKQKMLQSTCDSCHKVDSMPLDRLGRQKFVLPKGWMHVQGNAAFGEIFAIDLCDDCSIPVLEIAGKYKTGRQ